MCSACVASLFSWAFHLILGWVWRLQIFHGQIDWPWQDWFRSLSLLVRVILLLLYLHCICLIKGLNLSKRIKQAFRLYIDLNVFWFKEGIHILMLLLHWIAKGSITLFRIELAFYQLESAVFVLSRVFIRIVCIMPLVSIAQSETARHFRLRLRLNIRLIVAAIIRIFLDAISLFSLRLTNQVLDVPHRFPFFSRAVWVFALFWWILWLEILMINLIVYLLIG